MEGASENPLFLNAGHELVEAVLSGVRSGRLLALRQLDWEVVGLPDPLGGPNAGCEVLMDGSGPQPLCFCPHSLLTSLQNILPQESPNSVGEEGMEFLGWLGVHYWGNH